MWFLFADPSIPSSYACMVRSSTSFFIGKMRIFIYLFIYLSRGGCVSEVGVSEEGVCCKIVFL